MSFSFEFRPYRTAFAQPVHTGHGTWTHREGVVIRIAGDSGNFALGEVAPIRWFGTERVEDALDLCASLGSSISEDIVRRIPATHPCCRFAFGSALESLSGNAMPPRSRPVARLLPAGREAIGRAEEALKAGFSCLKWKVGVTDSKSERSIFDELVPLLSAGSKLRLDANGAWDPATAREWAAACRGTPVEFIEQPLRAGADEALAALGADHPGLFALDESVTPPGALRRWLDRGWPGVVVVKPSLAGDPSELRSLLADSNADVVYSTALESTVGWRAALRFALDDRVSKRDLGFGAGAMFADTALSPPEAAPSISTGNAQASLKDLWNHLSH